MGCSGPSKEELALLCPLTEDLFKAPWLAWALFPELIQDSAVLDV